MCTAIAKPPGTDEEETVWNWPQLGWFMWPGEREVVPGGRSDGQEEAVAAGTWGQGAGGLGGQGTGTAGDLWISWGAGPAPNQPWVLEWWRLRASFS